MPMLIIISKIAIVSILPVSVSEAIVNGKFNEEMKAPIKNRLIVAALALINAPSMINGILIDEIGAPTSSIISSSFFLLKITRYIEFKMIMKLVMMKIVRSVIVRFFV